ncbi:MAG: carboxypeptidase-like regulatory domain-containing protein, partial [Bacteroidetes bacterium]|nr:carboxypeptidase-like regulatory domain-containing protein [Bacteroidota bacterium]
MKTRIVYLATFLSFFGSLSAQKKLEGEVKDKSNLPLSGVKLEIENTDLITKSDENGNFVFSNIQAKSCVLIAEFPGFLKVSIPLKESDLDKKLKITLESNAKSLEEVQVSATRVDQLATSSTIVKSVNPLERKNFGQDIPILLEATPSVVTTSDAGAGVGYTGIRIRGVDASRINVTINGIPVNDPESHDVYWVNMPDLASSIENLQIQRGVGSSTNGAAAFGASLNIKSQDISKTPFASIDNAYGSFNTWKTTIKAGTGLINNKFSLETRLSRIVSDGYIDRASSNLRSYYLAGSYVGEKSVLKAILFSGKEITYQSWYGTPESRVNGDVAEMNAYADRNFLTDEERANLLNSGRTYNNYTYKNQEDNYQQDNFQL